MGVRMALWVMPTRIVRRNLDLESEGGNIAGIDWSLVEYTAAAVRAVSSFVPRASCLTQAISTSVILRRRGLPSRIRIGVDKEKAPEFEAHAWVEVADRIVIGRLPRHKKRFSIFRPTELGSL
ncbi:MAG: lasso peptide biosynthesis B2 protein [Acidobacteriota bacterium]|nr:MAG: lasso peptide biosynthesis B2 protein [Acidobacteriota bacterium]